MSECISVPLSSGKLYRLAAFTDNPAGGNPAGVWIGDHLPDPSTMQQIAAQVGYSETAFHAPASGHELTTRYYSPMMEVAFCGHATIATGVLLGELEGPGVYRLNTSVGLVSLDVQADQGRYTAALTSVEPHCEPAAASLVEQALACLRWSSDELDPAIPPARAFAGAWHLVLAVSQRSRLASLSYDFDALKTLMLREELTTLQLVWRESPTVFHARDPFPVGGVVEDPATGAAAAALAGYLRQSGLIQTPFDFTIFQGDDIGRPGRLYVHVPHTGGIVVSGTAVFIP